MEKFLVRIGIVGVFIILIVACLNAGGCATVYGLGTDLRGAAKGMSQASHDMVCEK